MRKDGTFNWPERKLMCKTQLRLAQIHPNDSLIDGEPIEDYWEQQLEIATKHVPDEELKTEEDE